MLLWTHAYFLKFALVNNYSFISLQYFIYKYFLNDLMKLMKKKIYDYFKHLLNLSLRS